VSVGSGPVLINHYTTPSLTISHELQCCGQAAADLVILEEEDASAKD
jgi:hypothetical protein